MSYTAGSLSLHPMHLHLRTLYQSKHTVLCAYVLAAISASVQALLLTHFQPGSAYTAYNNFAIFRQSYFHLAAGQNLYISYPAQYWDLYKYSPSFALAMSTLAWLPDAIGLTIWNLTNALALYAAIRMLPLKPAAKTMLLWFILVELLTAMQNAQSNGLLAGLIVAAYAMLEKGSHKWAALWLVIAAFIKVYGAIGFCLFLFYPGRLKLAVYTCLWTALIALMPIAVTPWHKLVWQYHNWITMMGEDRAASYGLSVMGCLHSWFGINGGKGQVTAAGIALFLLQLVRIKLYSNSTYRLAVLASLLIWVIIFNHKAESPAYIMAVAGAGIWYSAMPRSRWRHMLLAGVFIFTCLSPTDIFPAVLRQRFFQPYMIKAIPCIVLWCVILGGVLTMKGERKQPIPAVE